MTLDIVIVNWNAGDQLRRCLESIIGCDSDAFTLRRVVVVDNASRDGSLAGLNSLSLPLVLIRNPENRGFAAACNQGAQESAADYILFLNPDTVLKPGSLQVPLQFMENRKNQQVGICGIQLVDFDGEITRTCARFPSVSRLFWYATGLNRLRPQWFQGFPMLDWDHSSSSAVDQVIGAFFLVRRSLFQDLGGFDERFFVYYEELDFSYRAKARGFDSYYLTEAQAFHKGGGTTEQVKARRLFYSVRSRLLYSFKHLGIGSAVLVLFVSTVVEPLIRILRSFVKGSLVEIRETVEAYRLVIGSLPKVFATSFKKGF